MKRIFSFALVISTLLLVSPASAKGPKKETRTYPISGSYHKLIVSSAFDVTLSDSVKEALVTIPEALQKQVVVDVDGGVLRITLRGKNKLKKRPRVVLPYNPSLKNIELSGAATLDIGKIERESVDIYLTGGAKFRGDITAKTIRIEQAGASDYHGKLFVDNVSLNLSAASTAEIRGRAFFKMELSMIEASSIDAEKFEVKRIEGNLEDASSAIVWCTERMNVSLRNASRLVYIGHPLIIDCPTYDVSSLIQK